MKHLLICLVAMFFATQALDAQTDNVLNKLFYGIHVDSSRAFIKKELKSDKRFLKIAEYSRDQNSKFEILGPLYVGKTLNRGFVKTQADSIKIELYNSLRSATIHVDSLNHIDTERYDDYRL